MKVVDHPVYYTGNWQHHQLTVGAGLVWEATPAGHVLTILHFIIVRTIRQAVLQRLRTCVRRLKRMALPQACPTMLCMH